MITGLKNSLRHLLLPHESNNHRAKLLHLQSLLLTVLLLVFSSFLLSGVRSMSPQILGVTHNISTDELFLLTNQKRLENNASPLILNEQLSFAAQRKADDMFAKDYWAHNAPDGTTPWVFIKGAGYEYTYAGENLARGYYSASDVMDAWMASPDHRVNILSSNYKEIGFAVKTGKLGGEETVLVVQEFGSRAQAPLAQNPEPVLPEAVPQVARETSSLVGEPKTFTEKITDSTPALNPAPLLNGISFTSRLSTLIVLAFIMILVIDMVVVHGRRMVRFVGHNLDHIFFLVIVLGLIAALSRGSII